MQSNHETQSIAQMYRRNALRLYGAQTYKRNALRLEKNEKIKYHDL